MRLQVLSCIRVWSSWLWKDSAETSFLFLPQNRLRVLQQYHYQIGRVLQQEQGVCSPIMISSSHSIFSAAARLRSRAATQSMILLLVLLSRGPSFFVWSALQRGIPRLTNEEFRGRGKVLAAALRPAGLGGLFPHDRRSPRDDEVRNVRRAETARPAQEHNYSTPLLQEADRAAGATKAEMSTSSGSCVDEPPAKGRERWGKEGGTTSRTEGRDGDTVTSEDAASTPSEESGVQSIGRRKDPVAAEGRRLRRTQLNFINSTLRATAVQHHQQNGGRVEVVDLRRLA